MTASGERTLGLLTTPCRDTSGDADTLTGPALDTHALSCRDDIHVLFTDVVMPKGFDGIQLARSTRDLRPEVRIALASGYPLPALRSQHGHLDDFAFIHKPYRLADLVRTLGMAT
ncbi:hypothetical protein LMG28727_05778 [Paraburkholderia kirstenboschensis]|uniref:hypothetical protein n=1 Tax=Paraburkholderia kirstenboschensis TaxID=1245436 RepID=UPI000AE1ED54|nr:hypothetical protein [Paraburkholderia kirstenboschensis]CAD6554833.1 hypothetical protein LMG28727_05778 [Paraburkholderia kirstenboschensis]